MKLTLGKKLGLGFGVILGLMIASGIGAFLKIQEIRAQQDFLLDVRVPSLDAGRALQRDLYKSGNKCRQVILAGGQEERRKAALGLFSEASDRVDDDLAILTALSTFFTQPENRDRLDKIKEAIPKSREMQQKRLTSPSNTHPMPWRRREITMPKRPHRP